MADSDISQQAASKTPPVMADSGISQQATSKTPPVMADFDISQQVTSKTLPPKPKDPKKVAAGKAAQELNRKAREDQRKFFEAQKALDEANMKIAKLELKNDETPVSDPPATESTKNVLTTTQWLSAISIVVSLAAIYYKREEIKVLLTKKRPLAPSPVPTNSPVVPKRGIQPMD